MAKTGGADSEAGGDAGRGEGRNGGGSGSGGGSSGGSERGGGFDGTGMNRAGDASSDMAGNRTTRNADGSFGPDHEGAFGKYADRYANAGKWGGAALGMVSGIPGGTFAGGYMGAEIGRHMGEVADQRANIEAAQRGMPDSVRGFADVDKASNPNATNSKGESFSNNGGGGSETNNGMLSFSHGMDATYQIPKSAYDMLTKMAESDAATNAYLQTLNAAQSKGKMGSELIDHHNSNVDRMNAHSERVFGEDKYTKQLHGKSTQTNPIPKQHQLIDSASQRALNEIEEAKQSGARFVIR